MSQYPFGTRLGAVTIDGVEIDVFSNGECTHVSGEKSFDAAGNYMGIRYQCVEFVRRYLYLRHGKNLAMLWQDGNACDWFDNRATMGLTAVPCTEARAGDVVTFTGGKWGHVAIVSEVGPDGSFYIAQQNFMNAPVDQRFCLAPAVLAAQSSVKDATGADYCLQSILRL